MLQQETNCRKTTLLWANEKRRKRARVYKTLLRIGRMEIFMKLSEKHSTVTLRTDTVREGELSLSYTLFYEENPHASYRAPLYSVRVVSRAENEETEQSEVCDSFADPGHALIFYELCRTHRVLPIHLHEVREDFEE